jgi:hypothetical protein
LKAYYILWWAAPISSFIFVAFFMAGKDAVDEYKAYFKWFTNTVLKRRAGAGSKGAFPSSSIVRYAPVVLIVCLILT